MQIEFDPVKNASNLAKHGLAFDLAEELDLKTALSWVDSRFDYSEERWESIGPIRGRVCVLIYCRTTNGIRVISLRKANKKEVRIYENALDR